MKTSSVSSSVIIEVDFLVTVYQRICMLCDFSYHVLDVWPHGEYAIMVLWSEGDNQFLRSLARLTLTRTYHILLSFFELLLLDLFPCSSLSQSHYFTFLLFLLLQQLL